MKPPFILGTYRGPKNNDKNKRIIFTKNVYVPDVKNHDWQEDQESWPYDNEVENCRMSHYKKFGQDCYCYATTTGDMLKQIEQKGDYMSVKPAQKITSYFSFRDTNVCKKMDDLMFPEICVSDYRTTTQKHYTPPYPFLPSTPASRKEKNFMKNRMMKREDPYNSKYMFWDEDIPEIVKGLQCRDGKPRKSYDFCKGAYTDGSLPAEKKHRCFEYKSLYL